MKDVENRVTILEMKIENLKKHFMNMQDSQIKTLEALTSE